ncbi:MAG: RNA polymerase sigma factor [Paraglaciecola sp.]|uniref:RNA polymerase sigma factor n=1 Tax=Paraglaciecola sp. TaxID=1920173 RepID=UPI00273E4549|nr:RNA polymerase sigma factor [Paraglaciecola sp.]MDP5031535.1 RNA polymerase sigma factor [Paraglaciecola sp.]MDP5132495.1 RNA polymerase sigma factor [Paraglaciecola sp.]
MKKNDPFIKLMPKIRTFVQARTQNADVTNDVLQETMLRTIRNNQKQDSEQKLDNPLAYLITVAKSALFDHWRTEKKHLSQSDMVDEHTQGPQLEDDFIKLEQVKILSKVIDEMPPLRQQVFKMRRLEGKSREVIATEMGLSLEAVKKHINRAMVDIALFAEKNDWQ